LQLTQALKHWGSTDFEQTLKAELENLPADTLPLQQATSQGGIVDDSNISASVLSSEASDKEIRIRTGVFFTEIVAGCNCSDPPLETNGYCLLEIVIDRTSAEASVALIPD
jgi:hypothetical protein